MLFRQKRSYSLITLSVFPSRQGLVVGHQEPIDPGRVGNRSALIGTSRRRIQQNGVHAYPPNRMKARMKAPATSPTNAERVSTIAIS